MERKKSILLVEDSDMDAELILQILNEIGLPMVIERARDGAEAIELVQCENGFTYDYTLVLLDIKLPKMTGFEVLSWLKNGKKTRNIPVVMLTSSREEKDIREAYSKGASAYVVKPLDFNDFVKNLECVANFWCKVNLFLH